MEKTPSQTRKPRRIIFEDRKVQKAFLAEFDELHKIDKKLASAFGKAVKKFADEKIVSMTVLETYYITLADLRNISEKIVDQQLEKPECNLCDGTGVLYVPNGEDDVDPEFCVCPLGQVMTTV